MPSRPDLMDPPAPPLTLPTADTPVSRRRALALLALASAVPLSALAASALPGSGGGPGTGASGPPPADPAVALDVRVVSVTRSPGAAPGSAHAHAAGLLHPDVVRAGLRIDNRADGQVPFSPGQLRLLLADGTTVQPSRWEHGPESLPPSSSTWRWVEYLAPASVAVAVQYTPVGREAVVLRLPAVAERARTTA